MMMNSSSSSSSSSSFGIRNMYCNGIRRTAVVCNSKKSKSLSTSYLLSSLLLSFLIKYCIFYITIITIVTTTIVVGGVAALNSNDYLYLNDPLATSVGIIDITSVTDTSYVISNQPRIIEFYSPYCGHCKHFKKTYIKVAEEAQKRNSNNQYDATIEFYAISCAGITNDLCTQYKIDAYPTLYAIPANTPITDHIVLSNRRYTYDYIVQQLQLTNNNNNDDNKLTGSSKVEVGTAAATTTEATEATTLISIPPKKGVSSNEQQQVQQQQRRAVVEVDVSTENDDGNNNSKGKTDDDSNTDNTKDTNNKNNNNNNDDDDDTKDEKSNNDDEKENETSNNDDDGSTPKSGKDNNNDDDGNIKKQSNNNDDDKEEEETNDDQEKNEEEEEDEITDDGKSSFDKEIDRVKNSRSRYRNNSDTNHIQKEKKDTGAHVAKLLPKSMDQYKNVLLQRLQKHNQQLKRQDFIYSPRKRNQYHDRGNTTTTIIMKNNKNIDSDTNGATNIMLAHRRGTVEYNQRVQDLYKHIQQYKSIYRRQNKYNHHQYENQHEILQQLSDGQLPYKKRVKSMKLMEHVPIIKRIVSVSLEEELIIDTSLSFITGLQFVYKTDDPLPPKQKQALKDWLHLLHIALPQEWAIHDMISDLISNMDYISQGRKELKEIVLKHKFPRQKWSRSCSKGTFSCGFWKLLHTMTVGVAEYRGGQDLIVTEAILPNSRTFTPLDAADTVREYMAYFFPCTECSKHFIGQYDQCDMNRRCYRLVDDTPDASPPTDADWKELALWLWEFHNDVNVRLLNESKQRSSRNTKTLSVADQVKVIWPSITDCTSCLNDDGSFNENVIFQHLEHTYWPGYDLKDTPRGLILFDDDGEGAIGLNFIFLLVGLLIVTLYYKFISRASFAQTLLRAKTIGTRVVDGGKVRTI